MGKFVEAFDVYAKAAIKHSQIKTKLGIGCDGIELQMLDEIYRDGLHTWRDIEESMVHRLRKQTKTSCKTLST